MVDHIGGIVQQFGMTHQAAEILEEGCVVITVHDTLVQHELHIDVLLLGNGAVVLNFVGAALAAEGTKDGQVTEVIQMVINGADAQTAHGSEEQGTVEGAQLQQELGQQAKVIQEFQQPHGKLQEQAGNQVQIAAF